MTHEELLAKFGINAHYPDGCDTCSCGEKFKGFEHHLNSVATKKNQALCAVVKLHYPDQFDLCEGDHAGFESYPCSTIQAIEKELA